MLWGMQLMWGCRCWGTGCNGVNVGLIRGWRCWGCRYGGAHVGDVDDVRVQILGCLFKFRVLHTALGRAALKK